MLDSFSIQPGMLAIALSTFVSQPDSTPQPEQKVFVTNLDPKELPFVFPPIVLFPFNYIKLKPRNDVVNCLLLFKPAIVIDHYNLQEDNQ